MKTQNDRAKSQNQFSEAFLHFELYFLIFDMGLLRGSL
jgi:hypothetical protein